MIKKKICPKYRLGVNALGGNIVHHHATHLEMLKRIKSTGYNTPQNQNPQDTPIYQAAYRLKSFV
jgi:hypothetical protein